MLQLNCSSEPSNPAAALNWEINKVMATCINDSLKWNKNTIRAKTLKFGPKNCLDIYNFMKFPVQSFITGVESQMLRISDLRTKWIIETSTLFKKKVTTLFISMINIPLKNNSTSLSNQIDANSIIIFIVHLYSCRACLAITLIHWEQIYIFFLARMDLLSI